MGKTLDDATLSAYELVRRRPHHQEPVSTDPESDDDLVKPSSRLPPKLLPGRSGYLHILLATLIAISNLILLAVLLAHIEDWLPDTDVNGYGIQLNGPSCDLTNTQGNSRWQSAFQINLRGDARLSFAEAKFVDLLFDLLVGQGGRLLLAAVAYLVLMDALLRSMESTAVSYKLYASLVFSSTSLVATWRAAKAVFTTKGWRAKLYLTWCALAMIYVLAFPTLIESMTGYVSPSSPGFNLANGQFVKQDSDDLKSCYNVTAGLLMGFDKNYTKTIGPPAYIFDAFGYQSGIRGFYDADHAPPGIDNSSAYWALATYYGSTDYYQASYNPSYYNQTDAERRNSSSRPSKSISLFAEQNQNRPYNITINGRKHSFYNSSPTQFFTAAYCIGDSIYEPFDLTENPYCFNSKYFVWGFSSIVLYITLSLQLVWTLGMYCLWLDANLFSKLVKAGRTIRGPFRAAADLVEAVNETLGDEYCAYTNKEIEKELMKSGRGLRYYSTLSDDDDQLLHVGMTAQRGARVVLNRQKLYGAEEKGKRRG
ncbi:MAG: hypothetical protein Q9168_008189 [Polycauliona sp. 1 TL-2023]